MSIVYTVISIIRLVSGRIYSVLGVYPLSILLLVIYALLVVESCDIKCTRSIPLVYTVISIRC